MELQRYIFLRFFLFLQGKIVKVFKDCKNDCIAYH